MATTRAQRLAVIAHLDAVYAATRAAIEGKDFGWWDGDTLKRQHLGALQEVADGTAVLRRTIDKPGDGFERLAFELERSAQAIEGYTATATLRSVIEATAEATGDAVGDAAGTAVAAVANTAKGAVFGLLGALPWWVIAGGVLAAAGAGYWYLRPLLGARRAAG